MHGYPSYVTAYFYMMRSPLISTSRSVVKWLLQSLTLSVRIHHARMIKLLLSSQAAYSYFASLYLTLLRTMPGRYRSPVSLTSVSSWFPPVAIASIRRRRQQLQTPSCSSPSRLNWVRTPGGPWETPSLIPVNSFIQTTLLCIGWASSSSVRKKGDQKWDYINGYLGVTIPHHILHCCCRSGCCNATLREWSLGGCTNRGRGAQGNERRDRGTMDDNERVKE